MISALGLPSRSEEQDVNEVEVSSRSDVSRLEEQLKAFFEPQEAFNQRLEASQANRIKDHFDRPSKRLSKHLTVSII